MEGSVLCHTVKKIGTGTAHAERVHQNYQANQTAPLLYHNCEGQHQAKEPWHMAQPDC